MPDNRLDANVIKPELELLIESTKSLEPKLAQRLTELAAWVREKQPGKLRKKKFVCDFLTEVIVDATLWLKLKSANPQNRQKAFTNLSCAERFWYEVLFPRWFNENDPKLSIWKSKIMKDDFKREDEEFLGSLADEIEKYGGTTWRNYILDLSMATDVVVGGSLEIPLCTQVTTLAPRYTEDKRSAWKLTLCYWKVKRGLFVSYNPTGHYGNVVNMGEFLLQKGDELAPDCYSEHNL